MRNLDALLMRYFGLVAAAVSFAMLIAAHSFELFGGLTPCILCMHQRAFHWSAVGVGLVIGLSGRRRVRAIGLWVLAAAYFFGAGLAFYHVAVEHHWVGKPACETPGRGQVVDNALEWVMETVTGHHKPSAQQGIIALLNGTAPKVPACDKPAWWFLGLTMAGWNVLVSLGMALLSIRAALWKGARA